MDCNQHGEHTDSVETCLIVRHGVRARWVSVASILCFATGYLTGSIVQRSMPVELSVTDSESVDASFMNNETSTSGLIDKYQEEVVRLTRLLQRDSDKLRENQLLVREMNRRGVDADSASCRRLNDETQRLKIAVAQANSELDRAREQLAKLADVRSSAERQRNGIDTPTEIDARRIVMEHDAGMLPK